MQDARTIMNQWLDGVNQGNGRAVLSLYSEDATLLPTFAPDMRLGVNRIKTYFDGLAGRGSVRVAIREASVVIQELSATVFCVSGHYDWHFAPDDTPSFAAARFTFIINVAADRPIQHHHSSCLPDSP